MTIRRSLAVPETRNIENPQVPLSSSEILSYLDGPPNASGVRVNEDTAMRIAAVWRSVNVLSGQNGSLPLKAYRSNSKEPAASSILDNPHPDFTPFEFWEYAMGCVLLWGDFFGLKVRDGMGKLRQVNPLHPSWVKVTRSKGSKVFETRVPGEAVERYTATDIFHIPGIGYNGTRGLSVIEHARQSLGMTMAAEEYGASLFGNGSLLGGILQTDQKLTEPQANRLKGQWRQKIAGLAKAHEIAVLDSGTKFQPISIPPNDAQFIESRKFQVIEIARWFGVPPVILFDVERSTSWGTGIEQQMIGFINLTMRPWLTRFEQRIGSELIPKGIYAKFNIEGLLRGDSAARAAFYRVMREVGAFNADDIRELEDRPPIPDGKGQEYLQPVNLAPLGEDPNGDKNANPNGTDPNDPENQNS